MYNINTTMHPSINKDSLTDIGKYILNGMSEKESCILAGVKYADLQHAQEVNEVVRNFIERKNTEFKLNHLEEIQKNKSEKNSMWLLEKLRPKEFGSKANQGEGTTINIINSIMKEIQNENTNELIVSRGNQVDQNGERIAEVVERRGTKLLE